MSISSNFGTKICIWCWNIFVFLFLFLFLFLLCCVLKILRQNLYWELIKQSTYLCWQQKDFLPSFRPPSLSLSFLSFYLYLLNLLPFSLFFFFFFSLFYFSLLTIFSLLLTPLHLTTPSPFAAFASTIM